MVSATMGSEKKIKTMFLGRDTDENLLKAGKASVPRKKPKYMPKHRAQTAKGKPKMWNDLPGI